MTAADIERGRQIFESRKYNASIRPSRPTETPLTCTGTDGTDKSGDGQTVLDDVKRYVERFVSFPSVHALVAYVLWIAHTHLMDAWESTPRLALLSPEPASGKTRALEVAELLVPRAVHAVNCTPAYLFRKVGDRDGRPTILYDEIDTVFGPKAKEHEDIRGLINAGHRQGAVAGRCVVRGKTVETEEIPAYSAVALAGLHDLPDTIMSRAVVIRMRPRMPGEKVEPWRHRTNGAQARALGADLADWADAVRDEANAASPELPVGIEDRDADVWEALLAVADLAGGDWPLSARAAAQAIVKASKHRTPSLGVQLLRDIRKVFSKHTVTAMPTQHLLAELIRLDDAPWATIRKGEALDSRGLSSRLKAYGIEPKNHRYGAIDQGKGYSAAQFEDAWGRYLSSNDLDFDDGDDDPCPSPDLSVPSVPTQVRDIPLGRLGRIAELASPARPTCRGCKATLDKPASIARGTCFECNHFGGAA